MAMLDPPSPAEQILKNCRLVTCTSFPPLVVASRAGLVNQDKSLQYPCRNKGFLYFN
jgi:hypothetical protein